MPNASWPSTYVISDLSFRYLSHQSMLEKVEGVTS